METNEILASQSVQQAVIEKLALLSLEKQQQILAFTEKLAQIEPPRQTLWQMMQDCIKDVPPEAFDGLPTSCK